MRFHYIPSTYQGRKFGKGFCGGAYRGCARICGGSLDDNEEDTPGPVAVPVNILFSLHKFNKTFLISPISHQR